MNKDIDRAIDDYLQYLRSIKNYSVHTLKAYAHDLSLLSAYITDYNLPFDSLSHTEVRRFTAALKRKEYAERSINRIISGIKSFYRYEIRFTGLDRNPFSQVRSMKKQRTLPTVLTIDEVRRILSAPGDDFIGARDRAVFHTLYSTGCRLSEMLSMNTDDVSFTYRKILVHGKGSKDRYVFLTRAAVHDLHLYMSLKQERARKQKLQNTDNAAVFVNKMGKRLTPQGVHYIFHTYVTKLGIEKHVTPHTFRHTFATHLLDHDAGIRVVQELLGHENISTTQIYSHVGAKRLKEVYSKNHPHGRSES